MQHQDMSLVGCDTELLVKCLPIFQKYMSYSSSKSWALSHWRWRQHDTSTCYKRHIQQHSFMSKSPESSIKHGTFYNFTCSFLLQTKRPLNVCYFSVISNSYLLLDRNHTNSWKTEKSTNYCLSGFKYTGCQIKLQEVIKLIIYDTSIQRGVIRVTFLCTLYQQCY